MKSQKELVDEILDLWKRGEHGLARFLLKTYERKLTPRVYKYMYTKMGISESKKIPKMLLQAKKIMGGKLLDQYDNEIDPVEKTPNPYVNHPWFKK